MDDSEAWATAYGDPDADNTAPVKVQGNFHHKGKESRQSYKDLYAEFEILKGKKTKFLGIDDAIEMLSFIKNALKQMKTEIDETNRKAREGIAAQAQQNSERIAANAKKIEEDREELSQNSRQYCDENVAKLEDEIKKVTSSLQEQLKETCSRLEMKCDQADKEMSAEIQRMVKEHDMDMSQALTEKFEERITDMTQKAEDRDKALDEKMVLLYKETADSLCKDNEAHEKRLKKAHAEFDEHVAQQELRHKTVENDLREIVQKLDASVAACVRRAVDLVETARSETSASIAQLSMAKEKNWTSIQSDLRALRVSVAEVASSQTRRLEWVIQDATKQLEHLGGVGTDGEDQTATDKKQPRSWLSPHFEAAGVHGLQLELQVMRPETLQKADSNNCAVCLWGPAGLSLVFKLYIGSTTVQLQHTFDGKSPCSTRSLCCWRDQVCEDDDTLKVGLDILEAIRQDELTDESLLSQAGSGQALPKSQVPDGKLVQHRYVNHRLLELVQDQVDRMRSRMTRQIEWRIEQASSLPKYFPEGECICSTTFEAAGVAGLQLVFYPSGYSGAKEGFCSFFLFCPSGSTLRCWLSAGKQRREARIAFDEPGFFGRTNFCRFDSCIEPADDTVLLALEIEEAQQTVREGLTHQSSATLLPVDGGMPETASARPITAPWPPSAPRPQTGGSRPQTKSGAPVSNKEPLPGIVDSVVKRHRTPGRIALEEVRQLPSIWTSKPVANISEVLDGFYSYRDIKTLKRPAGGNGRPDRSAPGAASGSLTDRGDRGGPGAHLQKGPGVGHMLNVNSDATLSTCTDATLNCPPSAGNGGATPKFPRYMMYAS